MTSPYRHGDVDSFIERDRRLQRAIMFLVIGAVCGAGTYASVTALLARRAAIASASASPTPGARQRLGPIALNGPDGRSTLGTHAAVVHVWLQACADCMPAFEAMRGIEERGGLGVDVPIYNVSYGEADPAWAAAWRVRRNLLHDPGGSSLVHPLGITTFTTLVLDARGDVIARLHPTEKDYLERVRAVSRHDK